MSFFIEINSGMAEGIAHQLGGYRRALRGPRRQTGFSESPIVSFDGFPCFSVVNKASIKHVCTQSSFL